MFRSNDNFEALECLNNSKAFKIRSRKFQFFGDMIKSKRKNSDVELLCGKNTQEAETSEASNIVQL